MDKKYVSFLLEHEMPQYSDRHYKNVQILVSSKFSSRSHNDY